MEDGSSVSGVCDTDNCDMGWNADDPKLTLDVICPYLTAYVGGNSGSTSTTVTVNCFKCHIDFDSEHCPKCGANCYHCTSGTSGRITTHFNSNMDTAQYNDLSNCQCTAIHQCQLSKSTEYCSNSYDFGLDFKTFSSNEQFIECQQACYENDSCLYGIYYNPELRECRFITGACGYSKGYAFENSSYYFASKEGCMSSPSNTPTDLPTQFSSNSPSESLSTQPTNYPSRSSTKGLINPTQSPSNLPTESPPNNPTQSPSDLPSQSPSYFPSSTPTELMLIPTSQKLHICKQCNVEKFGCAKINIATQGM